MNLARTPHTVTRQALRFLHLLRKRLPRETCQAFGRDAQGKSPQVGQIYVINLDRELDRWTNLKIELGQIMDSSGSEFFHMTERISAVNASAFLHEPPKDPDVDPLYTLRDQLFVEPQPSALPTQLQLDAPIRMSRAEIAVARSHIAVWRRIVAGEHSHGLVLEDDVWFHVGFAKSFDRAWDELMARREKGFDVLYVSYVEVKGGAPKTFLSKNVFRPTRGLWHLSGYILSREGAQKLLELLPCRGPIDLWINHKFSVLNVYATRQSLISQRRDAISTNSYSILPSLTTIGAITSERASLFNIRPSEQPVFAFGPAGSGLSSLAMALSMLGYRCCSDLQTLPTTELQRLFLGSHDRAFNAYVNIGSLEGHMWTLQRLYPKARFIVASANTHEGKAPIAHSEEKLNGLESVVLHARETDKWKVLCEHLRCAPPTTPFPIMSDLGMRPVLKRGAQVRPQQHSEAATWDPSPWIVDPREWWQGIDSVQPKHVSKNDPLIVRFEDTLERVDTTRWVLRDDTFTDNLAVFSPSNVEVHPAGGATLFVRNESCGVRDYTAASFCSRNQYLFGKFEATLRASSTAGIVTGFFLHRNSPRQEIDIEIAGNRPDRLLANVFYNPGNEGAPFDYGYRGAPVYIELGFDASKASHRYTIEWSPHEICWLVDNRLVHRRTIWDPTPIPHLPMALHVNVWPCRSVQLAGRLRSRRLPATACVGPIALEAHSVLPRFT